jgi:hypothetical protein
VPNNPSARREGADESAGYKLGAFLTSDDQLHASDGCDPHREFPQPLNRRLAGPQSRSGRSEEEIKVLSQPGIELRFLGHPTPIQVTIIDHTIQTPSFSSEF